MMPRIFLIKMAALWGEIDFLSRIYRRAVAMTLCFELQQSHEMDYVLCDEVYTRYLANTHFAR